MRGRAGATHYEKGRSRPFRVLGRVPVSAPGLCISLIVLVLGLAVAENRKENREENRFPGGLSLQCSLYLY